MIIIFPCPQACIRLNNVCPRQLSRWSKMLPTSQFRTHFCFFLHVHLWMCRKLVNINSHYNLLWSTDIHDYVIFFITEDIVCSRGFNSSGLIVNMDVEVCQIDSLHDDIIKWKHFPHFHITGHRWIFMVSMICTWTNSWANNYTNPGYGLSLVDTLWNAGS